MDTKFDISALPQTILILMVVAFIYYALRTFDKKFPQVAEKIKDATPWMGWCDYDAKTDTITHRNPTRW